MINLAIDPYKIKFQFLRITIPDSCSWCQALMQLEDEAGKEAKDDSDLELDPAETTRWGGTDRNFSIPNRENSGENPPLGMHGEKLI